MSFSVFNPRDRYGRKAMTYGEWADAVARMRRGIPTEQRMQMSFSSDPLNDNWAAADRTRRKNAQMAMFSEQKELEMDNARGALERGQRGNALRGLSPEVAAEQERMWGLEDRVNETEEDWRKEQDYFNDYLKWRKTNRTGLARIRPARKRSTGAHR